MWLINSIDYHWKFSGWEIIFLIPQHLHCGFIILISHLHQTYCFSAILRMELQVDHCLQQLVIQLIYLSFSLGRPGIGTSWQFVQVHFLHSWYHSIFSPLVFIWPSKLFLWLFLLAPFCLYNLSSFMLMFLVFITKVIWLYPFHSIALIFPYH